VTAANSGDRPQIVFADTTPELPRKNGNTGWGKKAEKKTKKGGGKFEKNKSSDAKTVNGNLDEEPSDTTTPQTTSGGGRQYDRNSLENNTKRKGEKGRGGKE